MGTVYRARRAYVQEAENTVLIPKLLLPSSPKLSYCGDYNNKPAYIDVESVTAYTNTTDNVKMYKAKILADGKWYQVTYSTKNMLTDTVTALDTSDNYFGFKSNAVQLDLDFAYDSVDRIWLDKSSK